MGKQLMQSGFVFPSGFATPDIRRGVAFLGTYRIEAPLDVSRLRRLGVVAIGREFMADIAIGGGRFFK